MADRFAYVPRTRAQNAADTASTAGNFAKTFFLKDRSTGIADTPETQVDFTEGPAPTALTPQPPEAWYRSYGRYAPPQPVTKQRGTF